MAIDQKKLDKLRWKLKRSLKIIDLIISGDSNQQIVEKVGCNRSLIEHYRQALEE